MTVKTYNPLLSEILQKVHNAKTKAQKINILRENDSPALRSICKWSFDPAIESMLPEGAPPYVPNEAPEGTEHSKLSTEHTKLYHYIKGGNDSLQNTRREMMFVQLLESIHPDDALIVLNMVAKKAPVKGLTKKIVEEAFPNLLS